MAPRSFSGPPEPAENHAEICIALAMRLRFVSIAPFDVPVVPPVYWSTATSSGFARVSATERADVTHDDALDRCIRPGLRYVVPEQVQRDHGLDARVGPQALQLPWGVQRIRLHDDRSRSEDGEERDDEMGCVRENEGHAIPRSDPDRPQACGEPIDRRIEVAE